MKRLAALLGCAVAALSAGAACAQERSAAERALNRWTSPFLTTFQSESELRRYLRAVNHAERARWAAGRHVQFARASQEAIQTDVEPPLCEGSPEECMLPGDGAESIVVTGTTISSNPSITNVQEAGVDEGDIVKQIGRFLLVLQDGRIFSIDTRPGENAGLALVDRMNIYRNARDNVWYDEMLVSDNRVLITGYSYAEDATELAVFRLDEQGRLTREGVFFLSSNDYYDTESYATRLVDGRLVVYTPIDLSDVDLDEKMEWPVVRRWQEEGTRSRPPRGRPLLGARDIYRPVRDVAEPMLHTISICPLDSAGEAGNLECRTISRVADRRVSVDYGLGLGRPSAQG